jgi:hypothetical protein
MQDKGLQRIRNSYSCLFWIIDVLHLCYLFLDLLEHDLPDVGGLLHLLKLFDFWIKILYQIWFFLLHRHESLT